MYDLIIIGGSAASTAASIYAVRRKLNFKIISKDFGGEVATSGEIGNWPGITETNGIELTEKFKEHLEFYGVKPELGVEVEKIAKKEDGSLGFKTNNAGGLLGGITNGENLVVRIAIKPTSSISKIQETVDKHGNPKELKVKGRHDPCLCPRAVPILEAMVNLVLVDHLLISKMAKI